MRRSARRCRTPRKLRWGCSRATGIGRRSDDAVSNISRCILPKHRQECLCHTGQDACGTDTLVCAGDAREHSPMPLTTYLDAIREAMVEEMRRDPRVFLIGEDVGAYGGAFKASDGMIEEFGAERVIDTPISEVAIVGAASGAALMGMRPIAEMQFIDFITCAYDMLVNFTATNRYLYGRSCPIVIRGPAGAGTHGGPFHSLSPEAMFMNRPGIKIVSPGTAYDAKGLLKAAIRDDDPVLFIEHKYLYRRIKETLPDDDYIVPIGKANVRRKGKDLTVVTWGAMIYVADAAAEALAKDGVSVEIVDLRSIIPFDEEAILESV